MGKVLMNALLFAALVLLVGAAADVVLHMLFPSQDGWIGAGALLASMAVAFFVESRIARVRDLLNTEVEHPAQISLRKLARRQHKC